MNKKDTKMKLKTLIHLAQKNLDRVSDTLGLISVAVIIGFSLILPQAF